MGNTGKTVDLEPKGVRSNDASKSGLDGMSRLPRCLYLKRWTRPKGAWGLDPWKNRSLTQLGNVYLSLDLNRRSIGSFFK